MSRNKLKPADVSQGATPLIVNGTPHRRQATVDCPTERTHR